MNRYFASLDGLIIAAEMAAAGDHVTAAKFLIGATKLHEYRTMVQAITEEQQQNKEQQEQDQDAQGQNEEQAAVRTPELSAALARVLGGNEMADTYSDSNAWQDQEFKDENDMVNQGSVESAGEEEQTTDINPDDLGIDLDEEQGQGQQQQQEEPASVTAALAALGVPSEVINAETANVATPHADLQARLLRNRQVRA